MFVKYCPVYIREARERILNYFQKRNIPGYVRTSESHPQLHKVSRLPLPGVYCGIKNIVNKTNYFHIDTNYEPTFTRSLICWAQVSTLQILIQLHLQQLYEVGTNVVL